MDCLINPRSFNCPAAWTRNAVDSAVLSRSDTVEDNGVGLVVGGYWQHTREAGCVLLGLGAVARALHLEIRRPGGASAVRTDVVRYLLALEQRLHLLHLVLAQTIDQQAHGRVGADRLVGREELEPPRVLGREVLHHLEVALRDGDEAVLATHALGPAQRVEVVLHTQHRRRVDGAALEDALEELARRGVGHAEDLGHRPVLRHERLQTLHRARAQDDDTVAALATEHLLPAERAHVDLVPRHLHGECSRRGVIEDQTLAVVRDPVGVGHAHAAGGAVPREQHVVVAIHLREVRDLAERRTELPHVVKLELRGHVLEPLLAERLPVANVHRALAQHRPHGHLERTSVRGRNDTKVVVLR
ncbi:hypothetical protein ON010_g18569 [Phytophthora cinnamomi]|nr:hypothetical protein ON010_g18569 [Phytophthora cinnamomi]